MSDDESTMFDGDEEPTLQDAVGEMVIPWDRLSEAALRGVIEELVTSEGTEYGAEDVPLEDKVAEVRRQLERGEVLVMFHPQSQAVNLIRAPKR